MRDRISSKDNRIYKDLLRLEKRKFRDRENRFIAEGPNLVREAIATGMGIDAIILRDGVSFGDDHPATRYMDARIFDSVSSTENSQGVLAVLRKPECTEDILNKRGGCVVVMDRLQDPGNVGTIIRTAEAAGYSAVICVKGTADPYSPKAVRAAAGSVLRMPVLHSEDEDETLKLLNNYGKKTVVTLPTGDNRYSDVDLSEDIALIVGNEGRGCSSAFIEQADISVTIPMEGDTESLNASVACSILMYERIR